MIEQLSELERRSDPVTIELAGVWTSSYAVVSEIFCCSVSVSSLFPVDMHLVVAVLRPGVSLQDSSKK